MYSLLTSLQIILLACLHNSIANSPEDIFDFIVVGGGTGGCAVASRLSESGKYSVLLLEAGDIPDVRLDNPTLMGKAIAEGKSVKTFLSVPQRNAGLEKNGTIKYTVGYTLGGSSSVNGMGFNRGSSFDYDNWARSTGDQSWEYANMLRYFRKVENYDGAYPFSDQHGKNGPIPVTGPKFSPGMAASLKAGEQIGFPVADPNGPQNISLTTFEYSQRFGRRVSSYAGYIKPFMQSRKNLKVIIRAEATKIEFKGKRAVGVLYRTNSTDGVLQKGFVRARKEIIVSAGVMGSPFLLLRSGLGPKRVLDTSKIPAVQYLPVGRNLKDHLAVIVHYVMNNKSLTSNIKRDMTPEVSRILNTLGEGHDLNWGGMSSQGFVASSIAKSFDRNPNWADTHLTSVFMPRPPNNSFNLATDEVEAACIVVLTRPKSHGTLVLNRTNVHSGPVIDFQFLTHPDDMQVLLDGIKTALRIIEQTPSYRKVGARLLNIVPPPCRQFKFRSEEFWRCYIRQTSQSFWHAGGTCKMGSGSQDPTAVVDPKLRVVGVEGLRVVDASVMPTVTNANTMVPVYGIAEKASDMILRFWEIRERGSSFMPRS